MNHSLQSNSPSKTALIYSTSTRNSSVVQEKLMIENLTVDDIEDDEPLEEVALKYTCIECRYTSLQKADLDSHVQLQHQTSRIEEVKYECKECGKEFFGEKDFQAHIRIHDKPASEKCVNSAENVDMSLGDPESSKREFSCVKCQYSACTEELLRSHVQVQHMKLLVNISAVRLLYCEYCEYVCELNIKLKQHIRRHHAPSNDKKENKYICDVCDFESDQVANMWEHSRRYHSNESQEVFEGNSVWKLVAEQNVELCEEIDQLKSDTKNAFLELAKAVDDTLKHLKDEFRKELEAQTETFKRLFMSVEGKSNVDKKKDDEESTKDIMVEPVQNTLDKDNDTEASNPRSRKRVRPKNRKPRVVWTGTSVSEVLDQKKLGEECSALVTFVETPAIKGNDNTLDKIVPAILENEDVDVLVLQAGDTKISNIKIIEALLNTDKDLEDVKKEWFDQVENQSKEIFQIAEGAVRNDPKLQVVIVKRLPRFDKGSDDILGVKPTLSSFGNGVFDRLWMKAGCPQSIKILEVNLNIEKPGYLKDLIFGSTHSKTYDGVHLKGHGACRHFNYRVKQILKPVVLAIERSTTGQSQSLSQQGRQTQGRRQVSYANMVESNVYSVPVQNRFSFLG